MKKSLLAIAAMTAFAGAAQAQSSVSVYGIMDLGYVASNYSGTSITANVGSTGPAATAGAANVKQVAAGIGQSAESTSRLGFKGSEDLGGGMSAIFTVELGLAQNNQDSTTNSYASLTFNRQQFVGLKKNGLGTATIGTQYTPVFDVQSITDASGNNNLVGNAVYSGSLQSSGGTFNSAQGPYAGPVADQSLNVISGAYSTRVSNALKFQSDRMSGFAGELFYAQSNQNNQQTGAAFTAGGGGVNNNTAWGLNGDYSWNKLNVVAAYQAIKNIDSNIASVVAPGTTNAATVGIQNGKAGNFGTNMADAQTYAAVTYDFGILKAYYQYINRKATAVQDSSYFTKRMANQIGVKSYITPAISVFATYGLTNSSYYGQGLTSANGRTFQIGSDYYLSKRTNLYAIVGAANQSSNGSANSALTTVAAQAGAGGVALNLSNYAVGVRHTF